MKKNVLSHITQSEALLSYIETAIADEKYNLNSDSEIIQIIKKLKTYDYYKQRPAIGKISTINLEHCLKDDLFVLGRNILQTADGGENDANIFFDNLRDNLKKFNQKHENHVLNGILFEIYFNSKGKFRYQKLKCKLLDKVIRLNSSSIYKPSFKFIESQLEHYKDNLYYIPGVNAETVNFDIIIKKIEKKGNPIYRIQDIEFKTKSILIKDNNSSIEFETDIYETMDFKDFFKKILDKTLVPVSCLFLKTKYDKEINDKSTIEFPMEYEIRERNNITSQI